ncbi:50S ribosomal protein L6 [Kurthia sibirica]|uniref:Large ribosomal subunit protein uL6 n=1 Tax=Kurthia sibirica TaxID=202750 RepID=A0A2U3AM55_9BACL|nr:50S ribosomal protein L6 [Kurthia sibirica]PWI25609.1 50S ribosomal protein L6 [Kurthia sibirica]GEK34091.1 50S ribosomal protein L6 [Kurthia sibirica]
MSRIGKKLIEVPAGVTVEVSADNVATVKGPKGELVRSFNKDMKIVIEGNIVTVERPSDSKDHRTNHGTTRALLANMVTGVSVGFSKSLELIGVGYRAQLQGKKLVLNVGFSHPVEFTPEDGIEVEVPANTKVIVKGISKEQVGALASNIRDVRPPEPYKGKGIRYEGEVVRRKEGKTGK